MCSIGVLKFGCERSTVYVGFGLLVMDFIVFFLIWLVVGCFGFYLLDKESRQEADFLRFMVFVTVIPAPFLLYLIYALLRLLFGYHPR